MAQDLYHQTIMELARAEDGKGLPEAPDAVASVDNPLCGDRVRIAIRIEDHRISAIGHEVRGCALCQAAAALISRHAAGATTEELQAVSEAVDGMLREGADLPPGSWPELVAFSPVRGYKSRHECVRLPFRALTDAIQAAEDADPA